MYPGDNLCDIIKYTHVRVDQGTIAPVDDADSYTTFTTVCSTVYSTTSCGVSFDARGLLQSIAKMCESSFSSFADSQIPSYFTTKVSEQLAQLRQKNVVHLGILNMYDYPSRVKHYAPLTESALEKLAALKGPTSRIIYGIGFFYYNDNSSWQNLQVLVLAATAAKDIIVVITCVLSVPSATKCIALPPTALRSVSDIPARFDRAVAMAEEKFDSPSQVLAFSFQMGTLIYNMTEEYRLPTDALYKTCTGFIVSDSSQAGFVMNSRRRRANLTWFLFNVHLTDLSKKCHPTGPFERLKEFRKFFLNISRRGF
ncbi:hypothetical protein MRX96_031851 [Rhipicephalus microplus]